LRFARSLLSPSLANSSLIDTLYTSLKNSGTAKQVCPFSELP